MMCTPHHNRISHGSVPKNLSRFIMTSPVPLYANFGRGSPKITVSAADLTQDLIGHSPQQPASTN